MHGGCDNVLGVEVLTWSLYLLLENILVSDMSISIEVFRYINDLGSCQSKNNEHPGNSYCVLGAKQC